MKIKDGVSAAAVHPSTLHAMNVADVYWRRRFERQATVTSIGDGTHSEGSLHYGIEGDVRARAFDLRTRDLLPGEAEAATADLKELLGTAFDVVLERTHLHVELDLPEDIGDV